MNDMNIASHAPTQSTGPTSVRIERLLPGPIERLWKYITEPQLRATWFAGGEIELRPAGHVTLEFDHANISHEKEPPPKHANHKGPAYGTITRIEAPRLLAFDWRMGEENSHVTFELAPQGEQVKLTITHERLGTRRLKVMVAGGWDAHLAVLEARLEGREPPGFWSLIERLEPVYESRM